MQSSFAGCECVGFADGIEIDIAISFSPHREYAGLAFATAMWKRTWRYLPNFGSGGCHGCESSS